MTYTIVTAMLILALIAVVVAVVFMSDDDEPRDTFNVALRPSRDTGYELTDQTPKFVVNIEPEESQSREIRLVDVPEETDRDSGPFGI